MRQIEKENLMKRTVLITGASSGFGEACAEKFAQSGDSLILIARSADKLESLASRLQSSCQVSTAKVDVTNRESINQFFSKDKINLENVDILINSAGLALGLEPANEADLEDWETMVDTNIKGLMRMTRFVLPFMVKRNSGHIINIGSTAGSWPYADGNVYGGTKAFVQNFSRGLRADLLGKNIRVSNIEPGLSETRFSNVRFHGDDEKADKVYENTKPLSAQDIADIIYWVTALPSHININALEVMPVCQAWGPLLVNREMV